MVYMGLEYIAWDAYASVACRCERALCLDCFKVIQQRHANVKTETPSSFCTKCDAGEKMDVGDCNVRFEQVHTCINKCTCA